MSPSVNRQIPAYAVLLAFLAGGLLHYSYAYFFSRPAVQATPPDKVVKTVDTRCDYVSRRVGGFNYIRPLLFGDQACESAHFAFIKNQLQQQVNAFRASGDISNASVYLREFEQGRWMGLNCDEPYHPASLIKVPIMMAILRMADDHPELLDREITFDDIPKDMITTRQNYISNTIVFGRKYTVRELLRYMISYSDNNAQLLLVKTLKPTNFDHMFMDLGIGLPLDGNSNQILLSAKDYSAFMKTLFNATYLGQAKSEFAFSLMRDCDFKEGFAKGLPADTKVVHKFGEWDDQKSFELHESGIIYIQNKAFLLTVMTRGGTREKLPGVIAGLTRTIYDQLGKLP